MQDKPIKPCDSIVADEEIEFIIDLVASAYSYTDAAEIFVFQYTDYIETAEDRGFDKNTLIKHLSERFRGIKHRHKERIQKRTRELKTTVDVAFSQIIERFVGLSIYQKTREFASLKIEAIINGDRFGDEESKRLKEMLALIKTCDDSSIKYAERMDKMKKSEMSMQEFIDVEAEDLTPALPQGEIEAPDTIADDFKDDTDKEDPADIEERKKAYTERLNRQKG